MVLIGFLIIWISHFPLLLGVLLLEGQSPVNC